MLPNSSRIAFAAAVATVALGPLACSGNESPRPHEDEPSLESLGTTSEALSPTTSVATAVGQTCGTTAVAGLAKQLIAELECMRPNTFKRIDNHPGIVLASEVLPYLQASAADALFATQKARGVTMSINSALRTLPEQYFVYRWYQTGRCGIQLAATPGTSRHESALAVDVNDYDGWRPSMASHSYRWYGADDVVHFDYIGSGIVALAGLSVKAFQTLWNANNPGDKIAVDGAYGASTESRLAQAPIGGFPIGASCNGPDAGADGGADAHEDEPQPDASFLPDGSNANTPDVTSRADESSQSQSRPLGASDGCAIGPVSPGLGGWSVTSLGVGALALLLRGRRRS